jgi:hypothetical protein
MGPQFRPPMQPPPPPAGCTRKAPPPSVVCPGEEPAEGEVDTRSIPVVGALIWPTPATDSANAAAPPQIAATVLALRLVMPAQSSRRLNHRPLRAQRETHW